MELAKIMLLSFKILFIMARFFFSSCKVLKTDIYPFIRNYKLTNFAENEWNDQIFDGHISSQPQFPEY